MAILTLRARNTGRLVAVQLAAIITVTATKVTPENIADGTDSEQGDSPVFLSLSFAGDHAQMRFVTVDRDGQEDKSITDPDDAIYNFTMAAQDAERWIHR